MRRSEREITDRAEIDAVIGSCQVCRLGLCDMCFGYDGEFVYFHSAVAGRKLDILRRNPRVCVEFDQLLDLVEGKEACGWGMHYRSVVGTGTAEFVEGLEAKRAGLALVMAQYSDGDFSFPEGAVDRVSVFRVRLDQLTGKQAG